MRLTDFLKKFYQSPLDRGLLLLIPLLALLISFQSCRSNSKDEAPQSDSLASPDELIPAGFVLIPVQLENHQSIDSVAGSQSIVNLYRTKAGKPDAGVLMGRNLRMIRAPLNPQQFAVLVPETQVHRFISQQGQLHAVLQNSTQFSPTELMDPKPRRSIQFF